jgi:hypothetical protein
MTTNKKSTVISIGDHIYPTGAKINRQILNTNVNK